ncbi:MAG: resolvase [Betaproteobacteria bacterium]
MSTPAGITIDLESWRTCGWTTLPHALFSELAVPIAQAAQILAARRPHAAQLSGAHNPFGRAAALFDAWKFLELCENPVLLDAVEALMGPDVVLWDSELYLDGDSWAAARATEGRYWPVDPLAGLIADISLAGGAHVLWNVTAAHPAPPTFPGAHYVIRYMPATSRYNRDPRHPANRIAMEERPLVNYLNRPIWLARGEDRCGSDFATGFAPATPAWAADLPKAEV